MDTPKKTRTAKGPRRPKKYRPRPAERVCALICQGYTLREIAARDGMPTLDTLQRWLCENEAFRITYTRVRQFQREVIADDILAIADALNGIDRADRKFCVEARESRIGHIDTVHPAQSGATSDSQETLERWQRALERVRKSEEADAVQASRNRPSAEGAPDSESAEGER